MKKLLSVLMVVGSLSLVQADQVITDDLIVSGSECVGVDCVNGEAFSSDTLRLKENNLRIHFQDTSSTGSFPSADWRIVINDQTNGGKEYFAIEQADTLRQYFNIDKDGTVAMGYNLGDTFKLTPSGDVLIQGTLTDSSDVNLKENFQNIDGQNILSKIISLPISTWNYKKNLNKTRHIGAMAQDFYAAFKFGPDERHIAPKDAAFVAMVGVQELQKELNKKNEEIKKLKERLERLETLQTSIENLENLLKTMQVQVPTHKLSQASK